MTASHVCDALCVQRRWMTMTAMVTTRATMRAAKTSVCQWRTSPYTALRATQASDSSVPRTAAVARARRRRVDAAPHLSLSAWCPTQPLRRVCCCACRMRPGRGVVSHTARPGSNWRPGRPRLHMAGEAYKQCTPWRIGSVQLLSHCTYCSEAASPSHESCMC